MKRAIVGIMLPVLLACPTGCSSGKRIAKANDALRMERESLKEQVDSLESENAELRSKVSELNARLDAPVPEDVLGALPRVANVTLGRASAIESTPDGSSAAFLLSPTDGMGRFVQCVATVELRVVEIGEQGAESRVLGERVVMPTELRECYATGIGGASYLIRVKLDDKPKSGVALSARLHDAITGASHSAERIIGKR